MPGISAASHPPPPAPAWEGMVRLADGHKRFAMRFGDGPEVLLALHGGPGADLRTLLPLAALGDDRLQVVLYDQLGSGRSDVPGSDHVWTVAGFVSEFGEMAERIGGGSVNLLGHSWGGQLGLECALARPDLIRSLVLASTLARTATAIAGYEEILAAVPPALRAELTAMTFDADDDSPAGRALLELYATHIRRSHPFDLERSCREFVAEVVPVIEDTGPAYTAMWGANEFVPTEVLRDWDVSDRLGEISIPTLVVCGAHDMVVPACSREIVAGIAGSQWLVLGQSSHMIFHEAEAQIAMAAMRAFALGQGRTPLTKS